MNAVWQTKILGEVGEFLTGHTPPKDNLAYPEAITTTHSGPRALQITQELDARNKPSLITPNPTKPKATPTVRPEHVEGRNVAEGRLSEQNGDQSTPTQAVRAVPVHPSTRSGRTDWRG
jgi:4'-phosphopantetheinyl transferase EntD